MDDDTLIRLFGVRVVKQFDESPGLQAKRDNDTWHIRRVWEPVAGGLAFMANADHHSLAFAMIVAYETAADKMWRTQHNNDQE